LPPVTTTSPLQHVVSLRLQAHFSHTTTSHQIFVHKQFYLILNDRMNVRAYSPAVATRMAKNRVKIIAIALASIND
jgi:hypothetical protein